MTYVASMHTEHFSFLAVGDDEEAAMDGLVQTMRRHRSQYTDPEWGEPWQVDDYMSSVGPHLDAGEDVPHPDTDDAGWLRWLAQEYYGAHISGPYESGMAGTRDSEFITLRGE